MRIGVLLVGNVRTIDACASSLKTFLSANSADVFAGTYDLRYGYHPCVSQSTGFISDEVLSHKQISELLEPLSPIKVLIDEHSEYIKKKSSCIGKGFAKHEHASLMQFFKLQDILCQLKQHEVTMGVRYDILVKTRCDLIYNDLSSFELTTKNSIVIDEGNVFPNDCTFFGNRDCMESIIDSLVSICKTTDDRSETATTDIPHGLLSKAVKTVGANFVELPLIRGVMRWNGEVKYPPLPSRLRNVV
jgi:hypothetical protein